MEKYIENNLKQVLSNIEKACLAAGRDSHEVTLCAVSKTKPWQAVVEAKEAGQKVFGENYVQEIVEKFEKLGNTDIDWHMIGHLQTNKVKYIIDKVVLIHSVDSLHLAEKISKEATKKGLTMDILLEVNAAKEESKWGFSADELMDQVAQIVSLPGIKIKGLMTSAPYTTDPESNRVHFKLMKQLFDQIKEAFPEQTDMSVLSMGMSGDYSVAIEEGSTMVRVGTAIFGERDYH